MHVERLARTKQRKPDPADLVERAMAISHCRKRDRLAVPSLGEFAVNPDDFRDCMKTLAAQGAFLLDVGEGAEYFWTAEMQAAGDLMAKFERQLRRVRTAPGRAASTHARTKLGVKVGRLPALTDKQKAEAEPMWHDKRYSRKELAIKFKVSASTLFNYFGERFPEKKKTPARKRSVKK